MADRRRSPLAAVIGAALAALAVGGCGFGAGEPPGKTGLRVTKDFGSVPMIDTDSPKSSGSDTVMRLLQRNASSVGTRFGGAFVQSIDGVSAGMRNGGSFDWYFYVNGYISDKGAASVKLHPADRVWWDLRDWSYSDHVPALVGSYPEPFVHGLNGRRHPTRVECGAANELCVDVQNRLIEAGAVAAIGSVTRSYTKQTLRVLVGLWPSLRNDPTAGTIGQGPRVSGVFVRITPDGRTISTLDPHGKVVERLGPGSGLIAATAAGGYDTTESGKVRRDPVWVITGTDDAGLRAAVRALDEGALASRYAVVIKNGRPVGVPERPAG